MTRSRLRRMQLHLATNTVQEWAKGFVESLQQPVPGTPIITRTLKGKLALSVLNEYRESKKREEDEVDVERAKIHESVFKRIKNNAHAYAPVGLPPYYDVVRERDGAIITPDQYGFETTQHAADRAEHF